MTMQRVTLGGSNGLEVLRERPVDGRDAARTQIRISWDVTVL